MMHGHMNVKIASIIVIWRHMGHVIITRSSLNYRLRVSCFLSTKIFFFNV